jgi:SPX domain protein involved in polyphosphate accumulation
MKFDKQLKAQMIPEWKEYYVNYKFYKKWIKRLCGAMKLSPYTPPSSDSSKPRPVQLTRPLMSEEEEMKAFREFSESEFRRVEVSFSSFSLLGY